MTISSPRNALVATLAIATAIPLVLFPAQASTFSAWEVTNVPFGDVLNVRKYPASHSQKQAAYPNGTKLSLTGRCTKGLDLRTMSKTSPLVLAKAVRYRWCEIWHEPANDGNFTTGWVYGKYIQPY